MFFRKSAQDKRCRAYQKLLDKQYRGSLERSTPSRNVFASNRSPKYVKTIYNRTTRNPPSPPCVIATVIRRTVDVPAHHSYSKSRVKCVFAALTQSCWGKQTYSGRHAERFHFIQPAYSNTLLQNSHSSFKQVLLLPVRQCGQVWCLAVAHLVSEHQNSWHCGRSWKTPKQREGKAHIQHFLSNAALGPCGFLQMCILISAH